ncbi:MAG: single-stranded DNA-binding protein [Bacillota bacterium]
MINKVILTGRLVDDPELRETEEGVKFSIFTLAVDRNYRNKEGEVDTDFIDIITWRNQAEKCSQYLSKGRLTGVEGSLRINKRKKGERTYINPQISADRVEFLDWNRSKQEE